MLATELLSGTPNSMVLCDTLECSNLTTIMALIIRTIELFEQPTFPGKKINYCIPSIRTPMFKTIIPISEHLHLAGLEWGPPNVY